MKVFNVQEILKNSFEDPKFYINYQDVGRDLVGDNKSEPYIKKSKTLKCWKISGDQLQKIDSKVNGILFESDTYILQWTIELFGNGTTQEEMLFYHWKGNNATKGYSPLPPEIEEQNPIVERICQWSEPALFFHMFSKPLVVCNGTCNTFNPQEKRLFMIRGELPSEIHLYEVPCAKVSLRSKGIFVLLDPDEKTIYYWYGSAVPKEYQQLVRSLVKLNEVHEGWRDYEIVEIGSDKNDLLFKLLKNQDGNYLHVYDVNDFTPRLFYLNCISGEYLFTEIEYPLRCKGQSAAFPFLQSHLYTADQPAIFFIDNGDEVWWWSGWEKVKTKNEIYLKELKLGKETATNYAKLKNPNTLIPVFEVHAGFEPMEFTNIFPFWINGLL